MKPSKSESGAALLTVLTVLTIMGIVVALIMNRSRAGITPWAREIERTQATYAAESGIAFQLYLERFSDSTSPTFGPDSSEKDANPFADPDSLTEVFSYRFDPEASIPEVTVDRNRAFLDITAIGRYRNASATIFARFGKALEDSVFGPALTLENSEPLEPFSRENIRGQLRFKTPTLGVATLPWPAGFSVSAYITAFTDKKYHALDASLRKKLAAEGGESGNGSYSKEAPPEFARQKDFCFPLGQVELVNNSEVTWVLRGPGRIFADGDIRVRGKIRLENIQLFSGKNITFEDSVSGEDNTVYAAGSIFLHDKCNLGLEALAGKDILLRDRSQTTTGSVLITTGNRYAAKGADTLNAIRIVNQAVARGFLIASGPGGRVVLGTPENLVEGVIMAASVWLAGVVHGPVLTQKLLCEGTNQHNCLGTGKIDRSLLPPDFVQPLELGPADRRHFTFKLMEWHRS